MSVQSVASRKKYVEVNLNNKPVHLQLDSGSDISIIDMRTWKQIGSPRLKPLSVAARTASEAGLMLESEFLCEATLGYVTAEVTIRVAKYDLMLFGADLFELLGLWSTPFETYCYREGRNLKQHDRLHQKQTECLVANIKAGDDIDYAAGTGNAIPFPYSLGMGSAR